MSSVLLSRLASAAALLGLERIFYFWLSRRPLTFVRICRSAGGLDPVRAVEGLFYAFKTIQAGVFLWWCLAFSGGALLPVAAGPVAVAAGALLVAGSQVLNVMAFRRLGRVAAFYGREFGLSVPWRSEPPFTWTRHPQYLASVGTTWGVFLIFRFPHDDWFWLPLLTTVYYWLGATLERYGPPRASQS